MEGLPNYEKDVRPWGQFERFTLNEQSTVKVITVNPNEELSLQQHEHRDEEWYILSGSGAVTIGQQKLPVKRGENFFVARGVKHRVSGGPHGLTFLEIALGDFDENDIKRFEDRYGRA
ncbi:MAG TPA: phosphomannose isomerase type II C-terminal cupin domain [Candidatus Paceibacterota bacterium]|nr:phosphomannose isomerase type II C-terminal cupin domain [Candidatus Paceibacterota bacterium]